MGCGPSKDEAHRGTQANGGTAPPAGTRIPPVSAVGGSRLNQRLSEKAKHSFPSSFFEREQTFRQEQAPRKAVPERRAGLCRMRTGAWGSWKDGWCALSGHQLKFYAGAAGPLPPGAQPDCSLELVGAHLRAEHRQEVALAPPGGAAAVTFSFPNEEQREEWMVGLGGVPGLFRRAKDYYELGAAWGHGATCVVQECLSRFTGRRLALKSRLKKDSREASQAMHNELRILQICAKKPHPAIPQLHDYFFDEDGSIELVMDLMEGGELFGHIATVDQLQEHEARDIFKQVVEGVAHLHSLGIAHRDLKPQNLMYVSADEGAQVKIMDYDLAKVNYAPNWEGHTPCGTLHYMAPEIVQHQRYSQAVDMWSLGVILFILLTGHMPFDGKDSEGIAAAIEAGRYCLDPKLWGNVSAEAQDLVRSLLQTDPEQRLTADQVLQQPWLTARLEERTPVQLASPVQLRHTFSKTERGRQMLALAAQACSEGDLRQPRQAAAGGAMAPPMLKTMSAALRRTSPATGSALDFDMQPVRDQASSPSAFASGGALLLANGNKPSTAAGQEEDAEVARLRSQLQLVGTAAGLQDRQALELQGQELLGGSPRTSLMPGWQQEQQQQCQQWQQHAAVPAATRNRQRQQQQQTGRAGLSSAVPSGFPLSDSFADLEALEVEEQDLPGSALADTSRTASFCLNGPSSGRGGSGRGAAAFGSLFTSAQRSPLDLSRAASGSTAREQPPLAPLQLKRQLPPEQALPADRQLLERLSAQPAESAARAAAAAGAAAGSAGPASAGGRGLHRTHSAAEYGGGGGLARSSSTSHLHKKDARLAEAEREPVDLAMQHKRERMRRLSSMPAVRGGGGAEEES